MRVLAVGGIFSALLFLPAHSDPVYPHAYPRQGVRQLFDNERVTVWEAVWKHGVAQPFHRHRYDMAAVYLQFGRIRVTTPEGTVVEPKPFDPPFAYFQRKGITHKEEGAGKPGDPEELAIIVDLKETAPSEFQLPPGMKPAFPRDGAKNVLENDRVRMWDYTWLEKTPVGWHVHDYDAVEVYVNGGTILTKFGDGHQETRPVAFKEARYIPRGQRDYEEAVSGTPRAITIELK